MSVQHQNTDDNGALKPYSIAWECWVLFVIWLMLFIWHNVHLF